VSGDRVIDLAEVAAEIQRRDHLILRPVLDRLAFLQAEGLAGWAVLVLPHHVAVGATDVCGVPVVRADVSEPMVGLPGRDPRIGP
jgi:hypothetical protein